MRKRPPRSLGPRRGRGTALVLTLFFILLISALVVALLVSMRIDRSSTQSYYQSARVQELANGALEEIFSDLRSEIAAGSRPNNVFIVNGKQIYVPTSARASQPARIGYALGTDGDYATDVDATRIPPSLVRVSRAGVDLNAVFPATNYDQSKLPPLRASAVSSTNYSGNGRTISPKRWNTTFLLSGSATPPTRFSSKPPDWIYITRAGSRVLTDAEIPNLRPSENLEQTNTVLGRYAYVIYDEGGLLDINSSGYPSTIASATNGPATIRGKSSALYAALTSLPGLGNKTNEINELVNWRNQGSISNAAGNFINASTNWAKQGFLCVTNGDSPILSRRDLIDYFDKKIGTNTALPYLGTFSRYVAAPSARPAVPVGATAGYYNETLFDTTGTNRDLANVRFTGSATVTHYADDASSKTYAVKPGDPLLQSRFSLSRLGWLERADSATGSGPSSPYTEAIKSTFGLVWDYPGGVSGKTANGGNRCWNYVGSTGAVATPPTKIKTLDQVAVEGREPDFFELLKAAILSGSLGKATGPAAFDNGNYVVAGDLDYNYRTANDPQKMKIGTLGFYSYTFGPYSSVPAPARISDMQIIKIGANIIDQYDGDSRPTAIYFKYDGVSDIDPATGASGLPVFGPVTMAYGTENLPYLAFVRQLNGCLNRPTAGDPSTGTDLAVNSISGWLQPYIWNPHQPPLQASQKRPGSFEIRAYGSAKMAWRYDPDPTDAEYLLKPYDYGISQLVYYYQANDSSETSDAGTISFVDSSSNSLFYAKPYPLLKDSISLPASNDPRAYGDNNMAYASRNVNEYGVPNKFVAFPAGTTPLTDLGGGYSPFYVLDAGTQGATQVWSGEASITIHPDAATPAITYALGWKDDLGRFHPYSYMTGNFGWAGMKLSQSPGYPSYKVGTSNPELQGTDVWMLADPRTERFSIGFAFWDTLGGTITQYKGQNQRFGAMGRPSDTTFSGTMYSQYYRHSAGDHMVNSATDTVHTSYYKDPDGVVRPGDGFYGTPNTGDGMMLFTGNGAPTGAPVSTGDKTVAQHGRRPVILDRPFRSVGELGYVFRDLPFKSLDFFSDKSADASLLDVFCLTDTSTVAPGGLLSVSAGRVNPSAASAPVFRALLKGGAKKELDATYNLDNEADALAKAIAAKFVQSNNFVPVAGHKDLIPALVDAMRTAATSSADKGNKAYLEAPIRALSESTDMRSWNLMIDLIAQSGQINQNANKLGDFIVQAECRMWLHISIDRYTGEVIARQFEPVYE